MVASPSSDPLWFDRNRAGLFCVVRLDPGNLDFSLNFGE
jgi:hypothetical protein